MLKKGIIFVCFIIFFTPSLSAQMQLLNLPKAFTPLSYIYPLQTPENNFGYYPLGGKDHRVEYIIQESFGIPASEILILSNNGILNEKEGYSLHWAGNFGFIYTESNSSNNKTTFEFVSQFANYFTNAWEEITKKKGYLMPGISQNIDEIIYVVIKDISPFEGMVSRGS